MSWRRAYLASAANVGQASRLAGQAKRGLVGVLAAPYGAAGQARRLPYVRGSTGTHWCRVCLFLAFVLTSSVALGALISV